MGFCLPIFPPLNVHAPSYGDCNPPKRRIFGPANFFLLARANALARRNKPPSHKNSSVIGSQKLPKSRFVFYQGKSAGNAPALPSILTQKKRKSAFDNRGCNPHNLAPRLRAEERGILYHSRKSLRARWKNKN